MKSKHRRKNAAVKNENTKTLQNQVNPLLGGIFDSGGYSTVPLSQSYELSSNAQYNPLSLNRILLSYAYMTIGIIQTAVDQPVEDAFRGGLDIFCDEVDFDDLENFNRYLEEKQILKEVKDAMRWAKLFGGAGLIINTDQDPTTELNKEAIGENSPFRLIAADRWELLLNYLVSDRVPCPFSYYGQPLHKTRVLKVMGKEAPSFVRRRLQGWGMSEIERMIRDLNSYVKNQDVIYELLDEAKIDIWHIDGFNTKVLSSVSQGKLAARLQVANQLKNYHSAIIMDKEDDYEQKQITFSGLGEMLQQIRIGAAASVRMPMTKLFGQSAAGFSSGEDDIENYNALVESEVRAKAREVMTVILPLCFRNLFGFEPESLRFEFKKLRIIGAAEEANIKTQLFNRYDRMYSQGILDPQEYANILESENLVPVKTKVGKGLREPEVPTDPSAQFEKPQKAITTKVPVTK